MRRIVVLPNIFTTGNMVCGLSAILLSLSGTPEAMQHACWVILLALILDGLDGMIAVLTRSCTKFGIQYDSLADLISFGVAPAMLLIGEYRLVEGEQGPVTREYWAMSVVLVVCVALRLARYNVHAYNSEKKSFQGLPCPSPAAFIALLLLCSHVNGFALPPRALMVVVICLGMLMVSSIPYPSLRKSDFFQTQPLSTFARVVLVFALIAMDPVGVLFILIAGYILFGPVSQLVPSHISQKLEELVESGKSPR